MEDKIEETLYREGVRLSPIWLRVVAYVIDNLLVCLVLVVAFWDGFNLAIQTDDKESMLNIATNLAWMGLILDILYQWFFVAFYGASVGKIICKIKVVDYSLLDKPDYLHSFIRAGVRSLSGLCYYLPFLVVFYLRSRRALHDIFAKTLVICVD